MKMKNLLAAACLCLSSFAAQASTVLIPTDGDVNIFIDIPFLASIPSGSYLGLFDASDAGAMSTADHLVIDSNQIVGITGPFGTGDYKATSLTGEITLTDNNHFVLGLYTGGSWYADDGIGSVVDLGANSALLTYTVSSEIEGTALAVDVTAVPVPAALWLFGTGLIGLAGIARRRA